LFPIGFCLFVFETGSCYVAQAGLKLVVLLLQPPECWDYRRALPHPAHSVFLYSTISSLQFFLLFYLHQGDDEGSEGLGPVQDAARKGRAELGAWERKPNHTGRGQMEVL
jgi:hypothetical protein